MVRLRVREILHLSLSFSLTHTHTLKNTHSQKRLCELFTEGALPKRVFLLHQRESKRERERKIVHIYNQ